MKKLAISIAFVMISVLAACSAKEKDSMKATTGNNPTVTAVPSATPTPTVIPTNNTENYKTPAGFDNKKAGVQYGNMTTIQYASTTTGATRKCNVILPVGYTKDKKYPVLYLLHGIGGDHNEWLGGNPAYIIGNLIQAGETKDMIVVIPNVRAKKNDSANQPNILSQDNIDAFDNFINDLKTDLMPYIEKNYSIATGRENTAIAGLSMGGRESLFIGFKMPEVFGYIGAFSPAPGLLPIKGNFNYVGQLTNDEFTIKDKSVMPYLIMIAHGTNDTVVYDVPDTYHKVLEQNGINHIWYKTPGGHDFTVWKNGLYNFAKRIFK